MDDKVKTYNPGAFRKEYLEDHPNVNDLFQSNYESFFCLKIEDIKKHIKLPIPPSKEICHTLMFITAGSYKQKIGCYEFVALGNEIIATPAGQIFAIDTLEENLSGFTCHFHPEILIGTFGNKGLLHYFDFLQVWGNPHIVLGPANAKFVYPLFDRLCIEYANNGIKNPEIIQAYLFGILAEINSNYLSNTKATYSSALAITNSFKKHLFAGKANKKVSGYAALLNITPNHLNKCVVSVTAKPPSQWIRETVLMEAKYLLYQTHLTISEIALEVGYDDPSYFTRMFKKDEGITPAAYRKRIEKSLYKDDLS